jgi:hypothetical protein
MAVGRHKTASRDYGFNTHKAKLCSNLRLCSRSRPVDAIISELPEPSTEEGYVQKQNMNATRITSHTRRQQPNRRRSSESTTPITAESLSRRHLISHSDDRLRLLCLCQNDRSSPRLLSIFDSAYAINNAPPMHGVGLPTDIRVCPLGEGIVVRPAREVRSI